MTMENAIEKVLETLRDGQYIEEENCRIVVRETLLGDTYYVAIDETGDTMAFDAAHVAAHWLVHQMVFLSYKAGLDALKEGFLRKMEERHKWSKKHE